MKELRRVGFFKELGHGDKEAESLFASLGKLPASLTSKSADYLDAGKWLFISPGFSTDVISDERKKIGTLGVQTDGDWAWPSDLGYYVRTYSVDLPSDFVRHLRTREWEIPDIRLEELELP